MVPYCGTNIDGSDQTPRIMRGVCSGPTIFVAHGHHKKTFFVAPRALLIEMTIAKV